MSDANTFDYVIVGAGTAGCILANRLTEDGKTTVCLMEAGPPDKSMFIHMPAGFIRILFHPVYNWKFMSDAEPNLKNRPIYAPRGRTLGGSSSVNGMIYNRGHRLDFEEWVKLGNAGWSWDDLLPYFRKSVHNENYNDGKFHDRSGPLNIKYLENPNKLDYAFLDAAESLQKKRVPDFNTGENEGFGIFQVTIKDGRRESAATAFLDPIKGKPNLKIETDAQVSRVVLENGRATGVEFLRKGATNRVDAKREVIVATGTFQSPQVLQLSGIGPGDELKRFGIDVKHALPGVGKNLQDHVCAPVHFLSPSTDTYGVSFGAMPKIAWNFLKYAVARKGFLGNNLVEAGGFIRTEPGLDRPDVQHIFVATHQGKPGRLLAWGHGFRISTCLLHPKSRGTVGLNTPNAGDPPKIKFNFFSDAGGKDMDVLIRGIRDARRILTAPAFDRYRGQAVWPADDVQTDDQMREYVREIATTVFHPVGTCKMGKDDTAVVDDRLRVRGLKGLRVIDASVMPTVTTGNTNAPTMAIAEKGADMIRADARA
ncbi:MAG: GMC family oxidoreductase N-terminal domain-containing protein [Xanthobacteraceae bacterium]